MYRTWAPTYFLFSATEAGMKAVFTGNSVSISTSDGSFFAEGERAGRTMYHLKIRSRANFDHAARATPVEQRISPELLHQRLGHVNFQNMKRIAKQNLVYGLNVEHITEEEWKKTQHSIYNCFGCAQGKMHKKSYNHPSTRTVDRKGQLVHSLRLRPNVTTVFRWGEVLCPLQRRVE